MTDIELMEAVCRGDRDAYGVIVGKYLGQIARYTFEMLGNEKEVDDICQETFLRLWLHAGLWDSSKSGLNTWLHRIAHNLCVDHLRKSSRIESRDMEQLPTTKAADDCWGMSGDKGSEWQEARLQFVRNALDNLPVNQRSAITLCLFQNFSNKDAAAIMGISVAALESMLARARRSLMKAMKNQVR